MSSDDGTENDKSAIFHTSTVFAEESQLPAVVEIVAFFFQVDSEKVEEDEDEDDEGGGETALALGAVVLHNAITAGHIPRCASLA